MMSSAPNSPAGSWFRCPILVGILLLSVLTVGSGHAQDDRSLTSPTGWWWYHDVSQERLSRLVDRLGARITDIEIELESEALRQFRREIERFGESRPAPEPHFTVLLVKNEGPRARRWWWYPDVSGEEVRRHVSRHDARILDIELRALRPEPRFAVVLVENDRRSDWNAGYVNAENAGSYVGDLTGAGMRLLDFDPNDHLEGYATSVEIADDVAWWWYPDVTAHELGESLRRHGARLVDLEWRGTDRFSALMVESRGEKWSWDYDLTAREVDERVRDHGRLIDIETRIGYRGRRRFAIVQLENRPLPGVQGAVANALEPPEESLASGALAEAAGRPDNSLAAKSGAREALREASRPGEARRVASGYVCEVRRAGPPPSLRVTLTEREGCGGTRIGVFDFPGDGTEGPLSKLGTTESAMEVLEERGIVVSIEYESLPDGTNRAIEFTYGTGS